MPLPSATGLCRMAGVVAGWALAGAVAAQTPQGQIPEPPQSPAPASPHAGAPVRPGRPATPTAAGAPLTLTSSAAMLSNGARAVVVEKRDIPIVRISITFVGGAHQFESEDKLGVAHFAGAMLLEGTTSRTGDAIARELRALGSSMEVTIEGESGTISITTFSHGVDDALDLMADVLQHPTFPDEALQRLRGLRLTQMQQAAADPASTAEGVFNKLLYGDQHPYGLRANEQTMRAITRDDVLCFYMRYFKPDRAIIMVVGDIEAGRAHAAIERAFSEWTGAGEAAAFNYPSPPNPSSTAIYLVDEPGASQSQIVVGHRGPPRSTRDYFALEVLNSTLGGDHHSRLNQALRETRGYTYGVRSTFNYGRGPGAFSIVTSVATASTDSALIALLAELRGALGEKPFTDEELHRAKHALIENQRHQLVSVSGISSALAEVYSWDLPETYFRYYADSVNAVTTADLVRTARSHLDLDHLNIVIVGDRSAIEASLRQSAIAPVIVLEIGD